MYRDKQFATIEKNLSGVYCYLDWIDPAHPQSEASIQFPADQKVPYKCIGAFMMLHLFNIKQFSVDTDLFIFFDPLNLIIINCNLPQQFFFQLLPHAMPDNFLPGLENR